MHLFQGSRADPHTDTRPERVHPALIRFADECSATFGHLLLYVGTLALLVIAGVHLWDRLPEAIENEPAVAASWAAASQSVPALAAIQPELIDKTSAYEVTPRAYGSKDITSEVVAGENPVAGSGRGTGTTEQAEAGSANWLHGTETPGLRGGL